MNIPTALFDFSKSRHFRIVHGKDIRYTYGIFTFVKLLCDHLCGQQLFKKCKAFGLFVSKRTLLPIKLPKGFFAFPQNVVSKLNYGSALTWQKKKIV